jgi:hypothetical protein
MEQERFIAGKVTVEVLRAIEGCDGLAKAIYRELSRKGEKKGRKRVIKKLSKVCRLAMEERIGEAEDSRGGTTFFGSTNKTSATPSTTSLIASLSLTLTSTISSTLLSTTTHLLTSPTFYASLANTIRSSTSRLINTHITKQITTTVGSGTNIPWLSTVAWTVAGTLIQHRLLTLPPKLPDSISHPVACHFRSEFSAWTLLALHALFDSTLPDMEALLLSTVKSELRNLPLGASNMLFTGSTGSTGIPEEEHDEEEHDEEEHDEEEAKVTKRVQYLAISLERSSSCNSKHSRKSTELRPTDIKHRSSSFDSSSWGKAGRRRRSGPHNSLHLADFNSMAVDWSGISGRAGAGQGTAVTHSGIQYFTSE